jgi:hypothetical protein
LVAALLGVVGSCAAWMAIQKPAPLCARRFWNAVFSRTAAFAATWCISLVIAAFSFACWYFLAPLIGATLEPWLGERKTDALQLCVVALVLAIVGLVFLLADAVRATICHNSGRLTASIAKAWALVRDRPLGLATQALLRFGLAVSIHVANAWWITSSGYLARAEGFAWLAIATTEVATWLTIRVRLGWIAWLAGAVDRCAIDSATDLNA